MPKAFGHSGSSRLREKAPAAICRKVAEIEDGGTIDVWGDGTAIRSYTYADDIMDRIVRMMHSDLNGPVNVHNPEYVSVKDLADRGGRGLGKRVQIRYVEGPVGVQVARAARSSADGLRAYGSVVLRRSFRSSSFVAKYVLWWRASGQLDDGRAWGYAGCRRRTACPD